jgi:intracellular septation protein
MTDAHHTGAAAAGAGRKRWIKPVAEYGPLFVFFLAYLKWDLLVATAALLVATAIGLAMSLAAERRLPMMPLITAAVVAVFGGLTLWLQDEVFIKMKPTIVEALFSAVLFGGLLFRRPLLKPLLGTAWPMDDTGWHRLTLRFAVFFAAMAVLNEIVWRTQSTDFWVTFKVFGLLGLTLAFAVAQAPLMQRHALPPPVGDDAAPRR